MVVFVGFVWPEVWHEGMLQLGERLETTQDPRSGPRDLKNCEYQVLLILHQFDIKYYQYYIIEAYMCIS